MWLLLLLNNFLVLPLSLVYPTCAHTVYYMCFFFLCSIHPYKRKQHLECKTLYGSSMWGTSLLINLQIHSDVGLINIPPLRASSL